MSNDEHDTTTDAQEYGEEVLKQYEAIRRSGKTNMLDIERVKLIAHKCDFHALLGYAARITVLNHWKEMGSEAAERYRDADLGDEYDVPETITHEVEL